MSLQTALAALEPQIGTETYVGPWLEIDQDRIDRFADATGDHQWIHTEPDRAAAESPFGTTIAHGFLTLSLIPLLTGLVDPERQAIPGVAMAINYGLGKVRFPAPVPVGSRIRARETLASVTEAKGGLQVIRSITIELEGKQRPACVAEMIGLLLFTPSPDA